MTRNVAASIKARLLKIARERGEEFQSVLDRYVMERFLWRLGRTAGGQRCVVKGGVLLGLWMEEPHRSTRDVDLTLAGDQDEAVVRNIFEDVCRYEGGPGEDDGLVLDLDTLELAPIRVMDPAVKGFQAGLRGHLGKARVQLRVDISFGDAVVPEPITGTFPVLLAHLPSPEVRVYPRPALVAEKFEAMVKLGRGNSRMKDFHDIWFLSGKFPFDGEELLVAIRACFERRGTPRVEGLPEPLASAFYADEELQERWEAYRRAGGFDPATLPGFAVIGERIRAFLEPPWAAWTAGRPFTAAWPAGGPWRPEEQR